MVSRTLVLDRVLLCLRGLPQMLIPDRGLPRIRGLPQIPISDRVLAPIKGLPRTLIPLRRKNHVPYSSQANYANNPNAQIQTHQAMPNAQQQANTIPQRYNQMYQRQNTRGISYSVTYSKL